ncbi:hypothetical protein GCM10027169_12880 [Gordonia jinhuaensis]|uniref:Uncharacterized protein n=1 Tax=Gordonia jinhuaensis TaxID=1517702 RepID=A0A916SXY5_9ACTN|nr:hypothetical protein [Gordonia jinhuaensis]GGB22394.1 hypothetical protein GCM10011489_08220 [Gordonia jinhuaensis]
MSAADELQQWVEGGSWADQGYESELIPVDLARRVLAEMDEAKDEAQRWKERWQEAIRHADEAFAERDAALAKLDAVRAYAEMVTVPPYTRTAWHVLRILDRSTP